ncbi:WhiB family transcriptional regulator [Rhodococcus koreensis]|uniref:WhiB family transcriptional regulator n=1 Tax=Rhodococcus koreensis TaxID=99653 RepID=UPI00366BA574
MSSLTLPIKRLQPRTDLWDWQREARCRNLDADVFFSCEGEGRQARIRRERVAKQICDACPVRRDCRDHALSVGERYGVWGGTSEGDRRYVDAAQPLARPPKPKQLMTISTRHPVPGRVNGRTTTR